MEERKSFEGLVICPICFERLKSPRMLPCQHNFCLDCLGQYIASKMLEDDANGNVILLKTATGESGEPRITFNCPECERKVDCKSLFDIEKSLKCNQILDCLKSTEQGCPKCKSCKSDKNATFGCIDCDKQFCRVCFEQKECLSSSHFAGKLIDSENISCMAHDLELQYLCIDCEIWICLACFLEFHKIHKVKSIATVDTELRNKLRQSKSLANGNKEESSKLKQEIAKLGHQLDPMDSLKGWASMASDVVNEMAGDLLQQKEDELVSKVYHIGMDSEAALQHIENVTTNIEKVEGNRQKPLRFRSEIEQILQQCNTQEIQIMNLNTDFSQQKKAAVLSDFKNLFLSKLESLINKDIMNREKAKAIQDKKQDVKADSSHALTLKEEHMISRPVTTSNNQGIPLKYANPSGNPPHCASSNAVTQPNTVSLLPSVIKRVDQGEWSSSAQPSSPTSRHRRQRLNAPQSVSYPRLPFTMTQNALRHSGSEMDLLESNSSSNKKTSGRKVTIKDPKSGLDVTEEILRKGRDRRKRS